MRRSKKAVTRKVDKSSVEESMESEQNPETNEKRPTPNEKRQAMTKERKDSSSKDKRYSLKDFTTPKSQLATKDRTESRHSSVPAPSREEKSRYGSKAGRSKEGAMNRPRKVPDPTQTLTKRIEMELGDKEWSGWAQRETGSAHDRLGPKIPEVFDRLGP